MGFFYNKPLKYCGLYFLSKVDLTKLNKIFKWNPFKNESDWYDGFTCVNRNSSYHRWIQTMGFQTWSKLNCEYLFSASFLRACSIIRTNGVEYRRENDDETREINDASKYILNGFPICTVFPFIYLKILDPLPPPNIN